MRRMRQTASQPLFCWNRLKRVFMNTWIHVHIYTYYILNVAFEKSTKILLSYTMGSLLVMSKLPNFVFRKIQNCTGCQIFILGYHLQYNVEDHQANCMILLSQLWFFLWLSMRMCHGGIEVPKYDVIVFDKAFLSINLIIWVFNTTLVSY